MGVIHRGTFVRFYFEVVIHRVWIMVVHRVWIVSGCCPGRPRARTSSTDLEHARNAPGTRQERTTSRVPHHAGTTRLRDGPGVSPIALCVVGVLGVR